MQTAVIIIPTYNEEGNIGRMIDCLSHTIFPALPAWNMKILVVDGNSTDRTRNIVEATPHSLLLEEKKEGIGSAYLKGFKYAIEMLQADVVIEFDGDFQHPPESIPVLLAEIEKGADYVVGSRALYKGTRSRKTDFRHYLTEFGGFIARLILFFPSRDYPRVTDPTTGLKATRVKGFESILLKKPADLYSPAFGYKVQLLSEMIKAGARYKEIPLHFQNRTAGSSKFRSTTIGEVLISCARTRLSF